VVGCVDGRPADREGATPESLNLSYGRSSWARGTGWVQIWTGVVCALSMSAERSWLALTLLSPLGA
jgi:hypothetical protein